MSKMSGLHRKEQTRLFCQGHAGKVRFYKKVLEEWIEPGDGTFIVRIKPGFSFDQSKEIREMKFDSANKAMDSMHKVYKGTFIEVEQEDNINRHVPENEEKIELSDSEKAKKLIDEFSS